MKVPDGTSWLNNTAARRLCSVISDGGFDIYFVGGCVRNALMGLADSDIDMSTNALPHQVTNLAEAAGLKVIPTGIDHGTVTVVVDGHPFEITTFRRDVATDGRRAVVAFSQNITDDARRRDFTMNALYATAHGDVIDPLGGMPDLVARRVRFIEDPDARIKEDFLRILRFFRFSAWYSDPNMGFDADALSAIANNIHGLETLSAERVGQEMSKLLSAPDPSPAIATMAQSGVLHTVLPGSDHHLLAPLVHQESILSLHPNWLHRLAVLGGDAPAMRFRLAKSEAQKLAVITEASFAGPSLKEIAYRHGVDTAQAALMIRAALADSEVEKPELETILVASSATFPVSAKDLMPEYQGAALGKKLKDLEARWIASDFSLTAAELLR